MESTQGPSKPQPDREMLRSRHSAALYHAVWEASQVMSTAEIEAHVAATCTDIESDEP